MNIPKAIEILTNHDSLSRTFTIAEWRQAKQLSIEALKFYQSWSKGHCFQKSYLLPGETQE